jgi:HSP20 family molecular chaperone IbpA
MVVGGMVHPLAWRPPTDVYETDEMLYVRVEIAGMREDDFSIELNGRLLTIKGTRQDVSERRAYHQMEIRFGEFSIELELPSRVNPERVDALYTNGILLVSMPKALPRQIPVLE